MIEPVVCTRLIACLDLHGDRVVKGRNFVDLKDIGNGVELAKKYQDEGADEIILLDISATQDERNTFFHTMEEIADCVSIPVGIGGGIRGEEHALRALLSGAEKVGINSAAVANPELITQLSDKFGAQCVMVSIDAKLVGKSWQVVVRSGSQATALDAIEWAKQVSELGAGEILITSIDRDGTRNGYDLDLCKAIRDVVNVPVIASGGAGNVEHIIDVYKQNAADAALVAGILHDGTTNIKEIKSALEDAGLPVRKRLTLES